MVCSITHRNRLTQVQDKLSATAGTIGGTHRLLSQGRVIGKRCRVKDNTGRYFVFNLLHAIFDQQFPRTKYLKVSEPVKGWGLPQTTFWTIGDTRRHPSDDCLEWNLTTSARDCECPHVPIPGDLVRRAKRAMLENVKIDDRITRIEKSLSTNP